jgi:hypothetical protein
MNDDAQTAAMDALPGLKLSGRLDDVLSQLHVLYETAAHAASPPTGVRFYLRRDIYTVLERTGIRQGLDAWAAGQGLERRWYAADRIPFPQDVIKIAFE